MKLKPNRNRVWAAALTFLCGLTLNWVLKPAPADGAPARPPEVAQAPTLLPAAPCPTAEAEGYPDWGQSPEGEEWKYRTGGLPLQLDYAVLTSSEIAEAKVLPLASGRVLAAAGNTLYLLDGARPGRAVWRHTEPQPIFDFEHVAATGLVYVTAGDNHLLILEARTGRVLRRVSRNGAAAFGRTVGYGEDVCLVTEDNSGYRSAHDITPPMSDGVSAWRGTKMLWHRELPPDSELRVSGERVFAVTKISSRVLVKEITPPPAAR